MSREDRHSHHPTVGLVVGWGIALLLVWLLLAGLVRLYQSLTIRHQERTTRMIVGLLLLSLVCGTLTAYLFGVGVVGWWLHTVVWFVGLAVYSGRKGR